jgi:DNA modification methylase
VTDDRLTIICGDALTDLRKLPDESVQCCVTSPPYWGLRNYGTEGQLGLEKTPEEYVAKMVEVFREVRRVLRKDGTLWLNMGDSYASGSGERTNNNSNSGGLGRPEQTTVMNKAIGMKLPKVEHGLKPKDLIGIPWRLAFALQADGWWLRSDIIWNKPNPMPESVTDRPTKSHEYLFLLTKSPKYVYDAEAISEPLSYASIDRLLHPSLEEQYGSDRVPGKTNGPMKAVSRASWKGSSFDSGKTGEMKSMRGYTKPYSNKSTKEFSQNGAQDASATKSRIVDSILSGDLVTRNKRSVWTVTTQPFAEAHFATYPPDLIKPCILAGSKPGDIILDPFAGSGTTGMVAIELGRKAILIELNPQYVDLIRQRCSVTPGLALG